MGDILVGVDGSPASLAALEFAVREADLRNAELTVVHVYKAATLDQVSAQRSYAPGMFDLAGSYYGSSGHPDETSRRAAMRKREEDYQRSRTWVESAEGQARSLVESMVAKVAVDTQADRVTPLLLCDAHPAEALIEAATTAQLLVVGSRGRGGFSGLMLGSVSQQCVQHARCPVVVVRAK